MARPNQLHLAFYGDDFTGSTDALDVLTRAGARGVLFLSPPSEEQLARYPDADFVGVAGRTRALSPAGIRKELPGAFARLAALKPRHLHYKVCSTFDSSPSVGSIGLAIDLGMKALKTDFVPLLVGVPRYGRYCLFGNLFARMGIGSDGSIYRLDRHPSMSVHPSTPAMESDLRRHLAKQTKARVGLFDLLELELPGREALARISAKRRFGDEVLLFDVVSDAQMEKLGLLIDAQVQQGKILFSVGSSGIEMALSRHWMASRAVAWRRGTKRLPPAKPLLVVSGSCSPITDAQIRFAVKRGFKPVALDTSALQGRAAELAARSAGAHLKAGKHVVVYSSLGAKNPRRKRTESDFSERLGAALGFVIRACAQAVPLTRIGVAGGDTSSYVAQALGIESVESLAPFWPGAPLCRASAPGSPVDGLDFNLKGGQVGTPDYFVRLAEGRGF